MGMTADGLSYWQAESEGIDLLNALRNIADKMLRSER